MTPAAPQDITYTFDLSALCPADLAGGFFVGWPSPPSAEKHLQVLRGSYRALVAVQAGRVVGFITAISDGVATAFIPWLEVLPEARGQGIGGELVRRMQDELAGLYSIDLVCDDVVAPFYDKLGWQRAQAMVRRNPGALRTTPARTVAGITAGLVGQVGWRQEAIDEEVIAHRAGARAPGDGEPGGKWPQRQHRFRGP